MFCFAELYKIYEIKLNRHVNMLLKSNNVKYQLNKIWKHIYAVFKKTTITGHKRECFNYLLLLLQAKFAVIMGGLIGASSVKQVCLPAYMHMIACTCLDDKNRQLGLNIFCQLKYVYKWIITTYYDTLCTWWGG